MLLLKDDRHHVIHGILFTVLFATASYYLASFHWMVKEGISPLVLAVVLGMIYGSTLRRHLPTTWTPGIQLIAKRLLRFAIVLYGFRLTFQQVAMVGLNGILLDLLIVGLTLTLGTFIGTRIFKLDRDTALLISSGAAICGAAAVLATENVLRSEPYKATVAVLSVVLFGTIGMFLYPFMQHSGLLGFDNIQYGIYTGATMHEVAQVIVAGTQISVQASKFAVIVKMTRVILLAPTLIIMGLCIAAKKGTSNQGRFSVPVPWFAIAFIIVIALNSTSLFSETIVSAINQFDTFLLTVAMAALGIETDFAKVKQIGLKPLYLSLILFAWLIGGGYILARVVFYFHH